MTRRHFFKTSAAVDGALSMAKFGVRAQAQATDSFRPFSFLHFSDAHLSIDHVMNKNHGLCQMREVLRDAAKGDRYDFTIDTGDLTQDSQPTDTFCRMYKAMIQFAGTSVYKVPGNHDIGNHHFEGFDPKLHAPCTKEKLEYYRQAIGPDHFSFVHNHCAFIGINNVLFNLNIPDEKKEWEYFENELQKAQRERRVHIFVCAHYPVSAMGSASFRNTQKDLGYWEMQAPARGRFLDLLARYKVRAVLSGHRHIFLTHEEKLDGGHLVQFVHCPPLSFHRQNVAYLVARVDHRGITVEQHKLAGGFGRQWNQECPKEETNAGNWAEMAKAWECCSLRAALDQARLLEMSKSGNNLPRDAALDPWQAVTLPLQSANSGWGDANIKADQDLLVRCSFAYSGRENMMVLMNLICNNALTVYLNGRVLFEMDEILLTTDGRDHHKLNRLALDLVDFVQGENRLLVHIRKPIHISSMAFSLNFQSQGPISELTLDFGDVLDAVSVDRYIFEIERAPAAKP